MKAPRITSNNQFVQEGNFPAGTYTFNALVLATTGFYYIRFVTSGGSGVTFSAEVTPNEWSRVEMTFTLNTTYSKLDLSYYTYNPVVVAAPMLEYGNNASTAAPNPDDIDEELDDLGGNIISMGTEITQTKAQIQLLANKTVQIESDISGMEGSISDMEGALTVQATQIAGKVSQTDFNSLGQRVTSAEGALSVQATQIAAKVSQTIYDANNVAISQQIAAVNVKADGISLKVDNLQIGGTNLFSDRSTPRIAAWINTSNVIASAPDSYLIAIPVQPNSTYTLNADLQGSTLCRTGYITGSTVIGSAVLSSNRDTVLPRTITTGANATYIVMQVGTSTGDAIKKTVKLEKGNKATDWSPNPEDLPAQLLATGIDIEAGEVSITAPKFKVQDNTGTPMAVFKIGEDGKPVIKAENIEITSSLIANAIQTAKLQVGDKFEVGTDGKIKAVDGEFSGKITSTTGAIGGFEISSGRIGKAQSGDNPTNNGMSLYDDFIKFSNANASVFLGTNVLPSSSGITAMMRLKDSATSYGSKYGIILDISGASTNTAIDLTAGHISGLSMRTRQISSTATLTRADVVVTCYFSNDSQYVYMPSSPEVGEFKIVFNINARSVNMRGNGKNFKAGHGGSVYANFEFGPSHTIKNNCMFIWDGQYWIIMTI